MFKNHNISHALCRADVQKYPELKTYLIFMRVMNVVYPS